MTTTETSYTVDLVYPSAFGAFQAPIHLGYCAALRGRRAPPIDRSFTYCDLGTGAGLTLCVLADCYPEAQFHGIDLNPEHVSMARDLAERADLGNVHFHRADFAELESLSLPSFDFVALSGIYSWLSPALRNHTMSWISDSLARDGLLFLHYASLPGNAQIDSLYGLIREAARTIEGDSLARFAGAIERMNALAAANAAFFRNNPYARAWLDGLPKEDQRSMAHEVLNAQSQSLSARDAANEASPHGLSYVANAQLELNHMELVAPASLRPMLGGMDVLGRDMMLDAVRNAHSRMDVMALSAPSVGFERAAGDFLVDRLGKGPAVSEREKLAKATGFDFTARVFDALLARLDDGATTVRSLLGHEQLTAFPAEVRNEALQLLIATKLIHLLRVPYSSASPSGPIDLRSSLNRLLLEERIESAGALPLSSPVAGTQVMLPPADRLALLALVGGDFEAAWRRVHSAGQRITNQGQVVAGAGDLQRVAEARAAQSGNLFVSHLARLGII